MFELPKRYRPSARISAMITPQDKKFIERLAAKSDVSRNEVFRQVLTDFRSRYERDEIGQMH